MDVPDKVALVTGAGRGIGAAIAAELAARGHRIAVCDVDRAAAADTAAAIAEQHDVKTAAVVADIADSAAVRAAIAETEAGIGPVDVLVNNAAIDFLGRFVDSAERDWDRIIGVNLRGTITVTRAVLDGMIERERGRIIHIASDAGRVGSSGEVVYSATKAATATCARARIRLRV